MFFIQPLCQSALHTAARHLDFSTVQEKKLDQDLHAIVKHLPILTKRDLLRELESNSGSFPNLAKPAKGAGARSESGLALAPNRVSAGTVNDKGTVECTGRQGVLVKMIYQPNPCCRVPTGLLPTSLCLSQGTHIVNYLDL